MANILHRRDDRLVAAIIAIVAIVAVVALVYVFGLGRPSTAYREPVALNPPIVTPPQPAATMQAPVPTASSDSGVAVTQTPAPAATPPPPPAQTSSDPQ